MARLSLFRRGGDDARPPEYCIDQRKPVQFRYARLNNVLLFIRVMQSARY